MNPTSLPPETQLLKKLWINRYKVLKEADRLLGTNKFNDIAHAYLQCAEELENPPLDLLKQFEDSEYEYVMNEKERSIIDHARFINDVQS